MRSRITAEGFFAAWKRACALRTEKLFTEWDNRPAFTEEILSSNNSVIQEVAQDLGLLSYREYYCIDAILCDKSDRVPDQPESWHWVSNIRVAFEHEHQFNSGLFQETSHLLITRAELRVLVTYPENFAIEPELVRLERTIGAAGLSDPAFLLVFGKRTEPNGIEWEARQFSAGSWKPLRQE